MSGKTHLARIHNLPCVVCSHMGANQRSPTVAHHIESVRDQNSDYAAVAICDWHHRELHRLSRRGFERVTKLTEIDLLALTVKGLENEGMMV